MAPAKVRVREATIEDAGVLHAVVGELAGIIGDTPPPREALKARLSELLEEPRARVLVAEVGEDEGGVVGAVTLWVKPDLAHGDTVVEVPTLIVTENHRRGGVGRLLMDSARAIAAENGAGVIELVATSQNALAREFYRSLGFVETDHVALEFVGDMEDPPDDDE